MRVFKHEITNPRVVGLPEVRGDEQRIRISNGLWYYTQDNVLIIPGYGGKSFLDISAAIAIRGDDVTEEDEIELELPLILPGSAPGLIRHRSGVFVRQPSSPGDLAGAILNAGTYQLHDVIVADADLRSATALYVNYDGITYAFPLSTNRRRVASDYADFSDWSVAAFDPGVDVIEGQVTLGGVSGFSKLSANVVGEGTHTTRVKQLTLKTSPGVSDAYDNDQQSRAFVLAALGPAYVNDIERSKWPNLAGLQLVEGGATVLAGTNSQGYALVQGIHRVFIQHPRLLTRVTHGYVAPDSGHITSDKFDSSQQDRLVFGSQFWLHQRILNAYVLKDAITLCRASDGQLLCAFDVNDAITVKLKGYTAKPIVSDRGDRVWPNAHVRRLLSIVAGEPVIPTTLIGFTDTARSGVDAMAFSRIRFVQEVPECTVDAAAAARISQLELDVQSKEAALATLRSELTRANETLTDRLAEARKAVEDELVRKAQELERINREKASLSDALARLQREKAENTNVKSLEEFAVNTVSSVLASVFQEHPQSGDLPDTLARLEANLGLTLADRAQDHLPDTHVDELIHALASAVEFMHRKAEAASDSVSGLQDYIAGLLADLQSVRAREQLLADSLEAQSASMDAFVGFESNVKAALSLPESSSREDVLKALSAVLRSPHQVPLPADPPVRHGSGLAPWWLFISAAAGASVGFRAASCKNSESGHSDQSDSEMDQNV